MGTLRGISVFVTGANGFIGSHLTKRLIEEKADVSVLVKGNDLSRLENIKERIKIFSSDLNNKKELSRILKKVQPQKIFHLAALVNPNRRLGFDEFIDVNLKGTLNLLEVSESVNHDCFINTGTCEEYGDGSVPFKENQLPIPVSPYSASKVASTFFCKMYHKARNAPIVTIRPFLTYGPAQSAAMFIPSLITSALKRINFNMTEGEQTREFNYVSDIADGFVKASLSKKAIGEIINIGNGQEHKIKDVAFKVMDLMRNPIKLQIGKIPYRKGETMHFYCDNTKAKKILGWKPKVSMDEGLKKTIDWYSKNIKW